MGEFNCYGVEQSWRSTLSLLNSNFWHWTSWTYKINRVDPNTYGGWGIYYSTVTPSLFDIDSIEEIKENIYQIDTNHDSIDMMTFESSVTLKRLMSSYC